MEVRRITHRSAVNERQLYLASIADVDDWPDALPLPLKPFVGFMAIDVRPLTNDRLRTFARKLLLQRCVYTCCWGPDADRLDTAFDLELSEPDPTPSRELPYGKQRLLEIALALATRPKVLLLDEPAAGIPSAESAELFAVIAGLPRDVTIVFNIQPLTTWLKTPSPMCGTCQRFENLKLCGTSSRDKP